MHVLRNTAPLPMGGFGVLQPGEWLMHDMNAFECGVLAERGTVKLDSAGSSIEPLGGSGVLVMRSGRFGDLLMASPALMAFRENLPVTPISLSCFPQRSALFENTSYMPLEPYPMPMARANKFDKVISLENIVETERELHATDAFAKALGVTVTDYRPIYKVTEDELAAAALLKGMSERPLVTIQPRSSVINRDYPFGLWAHVFVELDRRGWEVVLLGEKGSIPPLPKELASLHITDLSVRGLTFRQSAAMVALADAHCGVDSAFLQIAFAVKTPCVGLFGPIDWKLRASKNPQAVSLTGTLECKGCGWHLRGGQAFPPGMPCAKDRVCGVLADIAPDRIVAKLEAMKP